MGYWILMAVVFFTGYGMGKSRGIKDTLTEVRNAARLINGR